MVLIITNWIQNTNDLDQ